MRRMKKLISALLSLVLLLTLPVSATAADVDSVDSFQDAQDFVGEGGYSWCHDEFQLLVDNQIIFGDGHRLAPGRKLTRAEFVALMLRLGVQSGILDETAIQSGGESVFKDVPAGSWCENDINWAAENGLVYGVGNLRFNPNGYVTFQEMMTFLYRFVQKYKVDLGDPVRFIDYEHVTPWALPAIQYFDQRQMWQGYPRPFFAKEDATRADAVFLIAKTAQRGNLL